MCPHCFRFISNWSRQRLPPMSLQPPDMALPARKRTYQPANRPWPEIINGFVWMAIITLWNYDAHEIGTLVLLHFVMHAATNQLFCGKSVRSAQRCTAISIKKGWMVASQSTGQWREASLASDFVDACMIPFRSTATAMHSCIAVGLHFMF